MWRTSVLMVVIGTGALLLGWRDFAAPSQQVQLAPLAPLAPNGDVTDVAGGSRLTYVTPNTIRLAGNSPFTAATAITQVTYGATQHEDRPHAITLVRVDRPADAMLAAARVTHFPVNSPVLYVYADRIPPETFAEMKRLGPDGNTYDNGVQVYLVGAISPAVERDVQTRLGYKTRAFRVDNPVELSDMLDKWAAAVHTDHPDAIPIVQLRALATGFPAVTWDAHMGDGLAWHNHSRGDQTHSKSAVCWRSVHISHGRYIRDLRFHRTHAVSLRPGEAHRWAYSGRGSRSVRAVP